ncbi:MAG: PKD domain-containing protein [Candidatus Hydrogenedentes bacterium]|nr:PKD domain-containing protein [Candidatus Hydrogenedentota bacterium]
MARPLRAVTWPGVLAIAFVSGMMGCQPAFVPLQIDPAAIEFSYNVDSIDFRVARAAERPPDPNFRITDGGTEWLDVEPRKGSSTGPDDWANFTVTVDRSKMNLGLNAAQLEFVSPSAPRQLVSVMASRALAADFAATPLVGLPLQEVSFFDISIAAPAWDQISGWMWDFGDGTGPSYAQNPKHTYTSPGKYTVTLEVRAGLVAETIVKKEYIEVVAPEAPMADFVALPLSPPVNMVVQFTNLSTSGDGIASWFWTFGDGSFSTDMHPRHVYSAIGMYTVSLTVADSYGSSDTETKNDYIDVQPTGPTAQFSAPGRVVLAGSSVYFTDLSDPGSSPITMWEWFFGDGGASNVQNPSHTYAAAGQYTVTLTVWTPIGHDTRTKTNYITVIE